MNKLSKQKQQQLIGVAVVALGILGALYWFVIHAQNETIAKNRKETALLDDQIGKADKLKNSQAQVQEDLTAVTNRLAKVEKDMATGDLFLWAIELLNTAKKPYIVDVQTPSTPDIGPIGLLSDFPYKSAKYVVRGSGFYHDIGKFVTGVENAYPYMRVQNLQVDVGGDSTAADQDKEKLSFRFELVTMVKPTAK